MCAESHSGKMRLCLGDPLVVCQRESLVELAAVLPASGRFVVARLDGMRLADAKQVFYDFSDALSFPATSAGTGTRYPTV